MLGDVAGERRRQVVAQRQRSRPTERGRLLLPGRRRVLAVAALRPDGAARPLRPPRSRRARSSRGSCPASGSWRRSRPARGRRGRAAGCPSPRRPRRPPPSSPACRAASPTAGRPRSPPRTGGEDALVRSVEIGQELAQRLGVLDERGLDRLEAVALRPDGAARPLRRRAFRRAPQALSQLPRRLRLPQSAAIMQISASAATVGAPTMSASNCMNWRKRPGPRHRPRRLRGQGQQPQGPRRRDGGHRAGRRRSGRAASAATVGAPTMSASNCMNWRKRPGPGFSLRKT
jgi:hypothetical protein